MRFRCWYCVTSTRLGFQYRRSFTRSTSLRFRHRIKVIDIGLRLADVQQWGLEGDAESFYDKAATHKMVSNLKRNGATEGESDFIARNRNRVELNALTSDQLIEFIEAKLKKHGVRKVVPEQETLETAFRRALRDKYIKRQFEDLGDKAHEYADAAKIPKLKRKIQSALKDNSAKPWDIEVADLAAKHLDKFPPESDDE